MSSKKKSKKITDIFEKQQYQFLLFIRHGITTPKQIREKFGNYSKQVINYALNKLVHEGLIEKVQHGMYKMTPSGKRIFDQYERYKNKQLVRVENLKVTFIVQKGGEEVVKNLKATKQQLKNNVTIYHAKLKDHSTRLFVTDNEYKFEVTVTNSLGTNPSEAFHHAMLEAYDVANYLTYWFDVELSEGYANGKPEIACISPISSSLLLTTGASQIRTDNAIMNRSKGRGADWEVYDLQDAQKIVNMPNTLDELVKAIKEIKSQLDELTPKNLKTGNFSPT
jgi:predicted transcriptional regulator